MALAWGVLVGGVLQFGVQIGPVRRLLGRVRLSLDTSSVGVRSVLSRFVPVLLGRGAIQIMGWVDLWLASYLAAGAVSSLTYTMVLYLLPVGLFGVSVAAAELPDLSQVERPRDPAALPAAARGQHGPHRLVRGPHRHAVHRGGRRDRAGHLRARQLHVGRHGGGVTLAFLSTGLLAVTATRLLQNGLYALDDARTPARLGVIGVVLSAVIGVVLMFPLDPGGGRRRDRGLGRHHGLQAAAGRRPGERSRDPHLGIVGLAIGAAISDWIEYRLLARALAWRVGRTHLAGRWLGQIAVGAAAAAVAWLAELVLGGLPSLLAALVVGPASPGLRGDHLPPGRPEARATVARLQGLATAAPVGRPGVVSPSRWE